MPPATPAPARAVVFTLDTLAPTVAISSAAETSNVATQTISGSVTAGEAAVGATVTLLDTVGGVTTQIGTATVGSGGLWTTTVTLSGDGAHSIVAQDTDAAGNTGTSTRGRVHARHARPDGCDQQPPPRPPTSRPRRFPEVSPPARPRSAPP